MGLNRYAKARDENEPQIIDALRRGGCSVERLDTPCDLLVGLKGRSGKGETHLVEVKRPLGPRGGSLGRDLTDDQERFRAGWKGSDLAILRSVADAQEWLKRKRWGKR